MFFKSITREDFVSWLIKKWKTLLTAFAILVLVAVAVLIWNWQVKQKEYKVQADLYKLKMSLKDLITEDENPIDINLINKDQENLVLTENMKAKANSYEQLLRQNQNIQPSALFAIDLSDFYYRYGEKQKAKELLSLFSLALKKHSVYHLASFQLASYYMNDKEYEKAFDLFSKLISNKKASSFHLESRLQKALCLEAMNQSEKALQEYEKIYFENSKDYIGRLAQDYKKLLILKGKSKK